MSANRSFHCALVASLALHALALFAFPEPADTARRATNSSPRIIARLMAPQPAPVPPVPAKQVRREAPRHAPSSPPPVAGAPESLSPDQYRLQLIDEARRYKRYPPLARDNRWQGDVGIGVSIGANGRASVSLKVSSGYELLDRQALEMFREAMHTVPVPPSLRGQAFALENVRIRYGPED